MKMPYKFILFFVLIINFVLIAPGKGVSQEKNAFILVSSRYQPYIENLDGYLDNTKFNNDINYYEDNLNTIKLKIKNNEYDFSIGIGLQAYNFLKKNMNSTPVFYSLLVYPQYKDCGIYLQPEPTEIIDLIRNYHTAKEIFIPLSQKSDSLFFKHLNSYAATKGININYYYLEELKSSIKQKQTLPIKDTLLFVPDKVFFSELIIKEFFEKLNLEKLFVVGYNPFFCRLGADLCIQHNFTKMGLQLADIITNYLDTGQCDSETGYFQVVGENFEK